MATKRKYTAAEVEANHRRHALKLIRLSIKDLEQIIRRLDSCFLNEQPKGDEAQRLLMMAYNYVREANYRLGIVLKYSDQDGVGK